MVPPVKTISDRLNLTKSSFYVRVKKTKSETNIIDEIVKTNEWRSV